MRIVEVKGGVKGGIRREVRGDLKEARGRPS